MGLQIVLDGYSVPRSEHSSIDEVSITLRYRDEEGDIAYGFSGSVEFYGRAYEIIKQKLITSHNYFTEYVHVNIYDDCCDNYKVFEGKITYSQIDWCEKDCMIKASIVQYDNTTKVMDCLKRKFIWESPLYEAWYNNNVKNNPYFKEYANEVAKEKEDERYATEGYARITADILVSKGLLPPPPPDEFFSRKHPFVPYCIETRPNVYLHIAAVVAIIAQIALAIITILAGLTVVGIPLANLLKDLFGALRRWVIDCEKGHVSPLVRDYLENGCSVCGLTFSSPIFQDITSPYYNSLLFYAPNEEGQFWDRQNANERPNFNMINRPLYTVYDFLEMLKETFNAEYRIFGSTLVFNRKDLIFPPSIWRDFSDPDHPDLVELCYEYSKEQLPAYAEFKYAQDGMCDISNEGWRFYNDIVDYNPNNSFPWLKDGKKYNIPFGMSRFRDDGVNSDPISFWRDIAIIRNIIFPQNPYNFDHQLLLSKGKCSEPKLLIWDGVDIDNVRVIKKQIPGTHYDPKFYYNIPYYIGEEFDSRNSGKPAYNDIKGNLYDNFWFINDSRTIKTRQLKFKLTFLRSCEDLKSFDFGKRIKLPIGEGKISEISIKSDTIEVSGNI
jgi:hypothetical protein